MIQESVDCDDVNTANDILELIDLSAVVCPDEVFRIGNFIPEKDRPLKLTFKRVEMAKLVLRKSPILKKTKFSKIILSSDKTRLQQQYYRNLKNELTERINNGENNIMIKYINNIPNIVEKKAHVHYSQNQNLN